MRRMYINFSDTVKIDLYVPDIDFNTLPKHYADITLGQAVKATITCLFNNATSSKTINYLDLKIIGNPVFEKYSTIYYANNIFKLDKAF